MSLTILPQQPGIGALLGQGVGQGLQEGIKQFLTNKRTAEGLESAGIAREQAKQLSKLPPDLLQLFIKSKLEPQVARAKAEERLGLIKKLFPEENATEAGKDVASGNVGVPQASPQMNEQAIAAVSLFEPQTARVLESQRKLGIQERRATHNDSKEFFNKTVSAADSAQDTLEALDLQKQAIKSGELGRLSAPALANAVGLKFIKKFAETPTSKAFKTASKQMFTEAKDLFGARPLGFEIQMMKEMQAEIGVREDANLATISTLGKNARLKGLKGEIARQITGANGGLRPANFEDIVNREFQKKRGAIKNDWAAEMFNAGFAKGISPTEIKLQPVPSGTPVNEAMADLILFKANNSVKNAEQLAKQLGYQF